ncbi:hypothetical protein AYI69_g306, partial [Smittium culicis]
MPKNFSAGLPAAYLKGNGINLPTERSTQALLQVGWITGEMAETRIAVDRWTYARKLSQTVLNESVPPVSRWSSSGIAVLRIADRCLHYPQQRIV